MAQAEASGGDIWDASKASTVRADLTYSPNTWFMLIEGCEQPASPTILAGTPATVLQPGRPPKSAVMST